jgi:tetratricopeptide (TPR) repeat protein
MKKIISFIVLSTLLVLGSCRKMVEEAPLSDGTLDQFYRNKYDAAAAIAAMYGQFQQQMVGEGQFRNRYTFWGEARSDNFESTPGTGNTSAVREMHYNVLTANNDWTDWTGLYRVISMANMNIAKFPNINIIAAGSPKDQLDNATFNSYMAQSYAMRAMSYFWIVRVWGDAPIRLEPYLDPSKSPELPRESQNKILDQIISDLTTAYSLIPKSQNSPVWYMGEAAIAATMADVYMWRHDYDNAIVWFKNVFKSKSPTGKVYNSAGASATGSGGAATDLEPTATWKNVFVTPTSSIEAIWNINWDVSANGCPCMTAVSSSVNNGPLRVSGEIFKAVNSQGVAVTTPAYQWYKSTTDIRPKQTINFLQTTMASVIKYYPVYAPFNPTTDVANAALTANDKNVYLTMYRLADQYLLYAEALNKKGDLTNALKYLNLIHVRAGNPAFTATQFTTQTAMEDAILQERQYELFAEGKRWFDLVRTDHVQQIMDPIMTSRQLFQGAPPTGFGAGKDRFVWPLHRNVLNANTMLVQYPPYN